MSSLGSDVMNGYEEKFNEEIDRLTDLGNTMQQHMREMVFLKAVVVYMAVICSIMLIMYIWW